MSSDAKKYDKFLVVVTENLDVQDCWDVEPTCIEVGTGDIVKFKIVSHLTSNDSVIIKPNVPIFSESSLSAVRNKFTEATVSALKNTNADIHFTSGSIPKCDDLLLPIIKVKVTH